MIKTIEGISKVVRDAAQDPYVDWHAQRFMDSGRFVPVEGPALTNFEWRHPDCTPDDFDAAFMIRILESMESGDGTV